MRTSKKQATEAAELIGGTFYGKDEHKLNGKCYIKLDGTFHEFGTYTEAVEWVLDEIYEREIAQA